MFDVSVRAEERDWENDIQLAVNEFMLKNYGELCIKYKATIKQKDN